MLSASARKKQEFLRRRWERQRACPDSLSLSLYLALALSLSISEECLPLCQPIHVRTGVGVEVGFGAGCVCVCWWGWGPGLAVVWVQEIKDTFVNGDSASRTACEKVIC